MDNEKYIGDLIAHFRKTVPLTEEEVEEIIPALEPKLLKRKTYILEPGQISRHMRYIAKGSMRCYYLDDKSQEHTLQIGIEDWWINDLYSYLTQKPSRMYLQTMEESLIIRINRHKLERLYTVVPALSDFFRLKIQNAYVALQERTIEHMSVDAYERYCTFLSEYRDIEQRVPQYIIASYLGMTPEFLSHLRKKNAAKIS
ncbi:Crp/Fnr family transcriptional regulator [Sphingobacterium spiritivorum]|uniref:Crp/Fnr family transcriptional regulator n=1 Tax=Sphingobacterium spiritivorum TaxID=258 RepID=UPI003DA391AE